MGQAPVGLQNPRNRAITFTHQAEPRAQPCSLGFRPGSQFDYDLSDTGSPEKF